MNFNELISFLNPRFSLESAHISLDDKLSDVILIEEGMSQYNNQDLYIGHISQIKRGLTPPTHLLYWGDSSPDSRFEFSNHAKILPEQFPPLFNTVKQTLMKELRTENEYVHMLKMLLEGKNLVAILNQASQRTQKDFVVFDISGKLLAHSSPFHVTDPLWIDSVSQGYFPVYFMNHIKQIRLKKTYPNTSEAFQSVCEDSKMPYLCSKILSDSNLLGYVFLLESTPSIEAQGRELLSAISRVASDMITHTQKSSDSMSYLYHSLISDMLTGIDTLQAKVRIEVCNLTFPLNMCVVNVRPTYYQGESYFTGYLMKTLKQLQNTPPPVYYKGGIVMVVPLNTAGHMSEQLMAQFTSLAQEEHLRIGISNSFNQASQLAFYYNQAEDTLRFAQSKNSEDLVHSYHDYAFFDLLNALPTKLNPQVYCHPALDILRKYDLDNKAMLYETLQKYTECGFNQSQTSELLYLHRNTLKYRLHRIEAITRIDFKNPKLLFQLMYSFQLYEYRDLRS